MKDRVPGSPGRVLITPEGGGAAFYATMARADNPIQEGDPLNKATLLTDETAALLGLGASAVPDDAFRALNPKIGDIINTVRTDLGDKWMLCNGETLLPKTYPAFAELMKDITWTGNKDFLSRKDILTLSATYEVSEVFYENGKYFFFYECENTPGVVILEADGVWRGYTPNTPSVVSAENIKVRYLDGKYIYFEFGETASVSEGTSAKTWTLYQSDDLINWEPFSVTVQPWASGASGYNVQYLADIVASPEGKYMVVTQRESSNYYFNLAVANSLSGPFVFDKSSVGHSLTKGGLHCSYAKGKFFIVYHRSSEYLSVLHYDIATATNTITNVTSVSSQWGASPVIYVDGYYVFSRTDDLYYSSDLATWNSITSTHAGASIDISKLGIIPYKGEKRLALFYSNDSLSSRCGMLIVDLQNGTEEEAWTTSDFSSLLPDSPTTGYGFGWFFTEGGLRIYQCIKSENLGYSMHEIQFDGYDMVTLPTITVDSAYAYIKVKE